MSDILWYPKKHPEKSGFIDKSQRKWSVLTISIQVSTPNYAKLLLWPQAISLYLFYLWIEEFDIYH